MHFFQLALFEPVVTHLQKTGDDSNAGSNDGGGNKIRFFRVDQLADKGVAVNALWPHSVIATAAISNVLAGDAALAYCRSPQIMADAAAAILAKDSREFSGNFCVDDVLLAQEGVTDFSGYRMDPEKPLWSDFFVPDGTPEIEPLLAVGNPAP